MREYTCRIEGTDALPEELVKRFAFPAAYCRGEELAALSLARRVYTGAPFCLLPFCHTLEAERLGANIRLGDGYTTPRGGQPICHTLEDVLALSERECPRMEQTLAACRLLQAQGETVVFSVSGPFTVLSSLVDLSVVFRGLRREPEQVWAVLDKLRGVLVRVLCAAADTGAMVSYADSAGSVSLLGEKYMAEIARRFTQPLLRQAQWAREEKQLLLLCPKTALALVDSGLAHWRVHVLPRPMTYQEACVFMRRRASLAGQCCVKNGAARLANRVFREIVWNIE